MKKLTALLLSIVMLIGILTGCGAGGESLTEEEKNTIVIWHDKEEAVSNALLEMLQKLVPEVTVSLEYKSNLTEALKMVGNDPKAAPDMYFFAHDKIGVYAEMGILAPVTDLVDRGTLDDSYVKMTLDAATYKGSFISFRYILKRCFFYITVSICRTRKRQKQRKNYIPIWKKKPVADTMGLWNNTVRHTIAPDGSTALTVISWTPMGR